MIDRLLAGTWTVDEVPRGVLSDDDEEFFSDVQEKLDWTAPSPTEDEREHGWLTHEEYVDWVRLHRIGFAG